MKVLHVTYTFPPDAAGGTEVYVEHLVRLLAKKRVDSVVCAPAGTAQTYLYRGFKVRRFATTTSVTDAAYVYGDGDETAAQGFECILDSENPEVVHLHAFTPAVSVRLAKRVQLRGIPIVFTYHTPTVTCQRGTMLLHGRTPCDGVMRVTRCTTCSVEALGVSSWISRMVAAVPPLAGAIVGSTGLSGGTWTAIRMSHLIKTRQAAIREMLELADRIIAPSGWVRDTLIANELPPAKIVLCSQGLPAEAAPKSSTRPLRSNGELRIAFFGRLHPTKGVHVLLEAIAKIPNATVRVDIHGLLPDVSQEYLGKLQELIAKDRRVRLLPAVRQDEMIETMRRYDILAVPSQGLETGPLVVLEAFAAGIPVIGSNLGGISERVRNGVDGILVAPADRAAWASNLERLARDAQFLADLENGVRPPPTMEDVCSTMADLYTSLIASSRKT